MLIATNPQLRRLKEKAHAERSAAVRTLFAALFTTTPKTTKGAQTA